MFYFYDFIECTNENATIIENFLSKIQNLEPSSFNPDLLEKLKTLSVLTEKDAGQVYELLFNIFQYFCELDTTHFPHKRAFNAFLNSDLFVFIKKLHTYNILDIETFTIALNEESTKNFEKILEIMCIVHGLTLINKTLVLNLSRCLQRYSKHEKYSSDYLFALEKLQEHQILNQTNFMKILTASPNYSRAIMTLYSTDIARTGLEEVFLAKMFEPELIPPLSKLLNTFLREYLVNTSPLIVKQRKNDFFSNLLRHHSLNLEQLIQINSCLAILKEQQFQVSAEIFLLIVKCNNRPYLLRALIELRKLPLNFFNQEVIHALLYSNLIDKTESNAPELDFISFCNANKIFNDSSLGTIYLKNIFTIDNFSVVSSFFQNISIKKQCSLILKQFMEKFTINAADALIKIILLTKNSARYYKSNEEYISKIFNTIEILEKNKIFDILQDKKISEQFIKLIQCYQEPKKVALSLECLIKVGLGTKTNIHKILRFYMNDIMELTQVYIELIQQPLYFSDNETQKIDFKYFSKLENPSILLDICKMLRALQLLSTQYFESIVTNYSESNKTLFAIKELLNTHLFSTDEKKNILEQTILSERKISCLDQKISSLMLLKENEILTPVIIEQIFNYPYPEDFSSAVLLLNQSGLSSEKIQEYFFKLINITPGIETCLNYAKCILELEKHEILSPWFTEEYLPKILSHVNPFEVAQAFGVIKQQGHFNQHEQSIFRPILEHANPLNLIQGLALLEQHPIAIASNLKMIALTHKSPHEFIQSALNLNEHHFFEDMIYQDYVKLFFKSHDPIHFAQSIITFKEANLLDKILPSKKFAAALFEPTTHIELFTRAVMRLHQQDQLHANYFGALRMFFKQLNDSELSVKILNFLLETPMDIVITSGVLESTCSRELKFYHSKLPSITSKLIEKEYLTPFRQVIFEKILTSFRDEKQIFDALDFLFEKQLLDHEYISLVLNVEKKLNNIRFVGLPILQFLQQEQFNLSECLDKMTADTTLAEIVIECVGSGLQKTQKKLILSLLFNREIYPENTNNFMEKIMILARHGLLDKENILKVSETSKEFLDIFTVINKNMLITQGLFLGIMNNKSHLEERDVHTWFTRIPSNGITSAQMVQLLSLIELNRRLNLNPTDRIVDFIKHTVLRIPRRYAHQVNATEFNTQQSTHTASVHKSVSESAAKLMQRYNGEITKENTEAQLALIHTFITSLPSTPKNDAAKRYWGMISSDYLFKNFQDPKSKVNIKQLLHLFWLAIHDFSSRLYNESEAQESIIEESKQFLVQAFYEAQRDGNINSEDVDDNQPFDKKPSCPSGFFNKLIEKLVGIHPDVQVIIISTEIVSEKFKAIVCEQVINMIRLEIQAKKQNGEKLDDKYIDDAVSETWNKIKENVAAVFFEEFKDYFKNDKQNINFLAYMDLGEGIELPQRQLQALHKLNQEPSRKRLAEEKEETVETASPSELSSLGMFTTARTESMDSSEDHAMPPP